MFDDDELEQVRDRLGHVREYVEAERETVSGSPKRRFAVALAGSLTFLVFLLAVTGSTGAVTAVGFADVGGFQVNIDHLIGEEMRMYGEPLETSACVKTFGDKTPEQGDQYLGGLRADIANARVPATAQTTVTKDILVPNFIPGLDNIRINISKSFYPSSPNYPPAADATRYGISNGNDPLVYIAQLSYSGLISGVTDDDGGYADRTNFRTRRNVTPGAPAKNFTLTGHGWYDYKDVNLRPYVPSVGNGSMKYVDRVALNGLDNANTGSNGGYKAFPSQTTDNITRTSTPTLTVRGVGSEISYDDARPQRYATSQGYNASSYVDGVDFNGISNLGTGNDGGYGDFTAQHSNNVSRGTGYTLTVDSIRRDYRYADADANYWGYNGGWGNSVSECSWYCSNDHEIVQITMYDGANLDTNNIEECGGGTGNDRGENCGDGYWDYTGPPSNHLSDDNVTDALYPGQTYTLRLEYDAEGNDHFTSSWFDWDRDGSMSGDAFPVGRTVCGCHSEVNYTEVTVPLDVNPGTSMMRVINMENTSGEHTFYPDWYEGANSSYYGEKVDLSLHLGNPSFVYAWVDWNHDGQFKSFSNEEFKVGEWNPKYDRTATNTTTITPPSDAVSGSTNMRVIHRENPIRPQAGTDSYLGETEDYTVNIVNDTESGVRAWVDWDHDGTLNNTLATNGGEAYNVGRVTNGNNVGTFSVSTNMDIPTGAKDGSTLLRVTHEQSKETPIPPVQDFYYGETEDYTLHTNASDSHIRAWIDLSDDGDFQDTGERILDTSVQPTTNKREFTIDEPVSIPADADVGYTLSSGVRVLRVTHKQGLNPPGPTEGTDFFGETEDYSAFIGPQGQEDYTDNITLGEAAMEFTALSATSINGSGGVIIDEDYADNTPEDPVFGAGSEFQFDTKKAVIKGLSARAHFFGFKILRFPWMDVNIEYNVPSGDVKAKADNSCYP